MSNEDRTEIFIQLLSQNERKLAAYVMTFVSSSSDADDILQETKMWLWRSFEQFEVGTNFGAWARQAAFYRIQQYFKKRVSERNRLVFSESCLEQLAASFESRPSLSEDRFDLLSNCIARLAPKNRMVLNLRYGDELGVAEVARRVDRTVAATYRLLSRIRLTLRDCLMSEGAESYAREAKS